MRYAELLWLNLCILICFCIAIKIDHFWIARGYWRIAWYAAILVVVAAVIFSGIPSKIARFSGTSVRIVLSGVLCLYLMIGTDFILRKLNLLNSANHKSTNVLLIAIDALRPDHTGLYGYKRTTTPSIDRLAAESVIYENAFSVSAWSPPSYAGILTGRYPSYSGVHAYNNELSPQVLSIAEVLRGNGYQAAGFVTNPYLGRSHGFGRGFQSYEEFWWHDSASSFVMAAEWLEARFGREAAASSDEVVDSVVDWLKYARRKSAPFFLFVQFMEPHNPYGVPPKYVRDFLPPKITVVEALKVNQDPVTYLMGDAAMSDHDFEVLKALYDNDIRVCDDSIGRMLSKLKETGEWDNTMIVVTADHGEEFRPGAMNHMLSLRDALTHVPLVIKFPHSKNAGLRIHEIVQTVDLFPSVLKTTDIAAAGYVTNGYSILPDSFERRNHSFAFMEYENFQAIDNMFLSRYRKSQAPSHEALSAIRIADWKYVCSSVKNCALYDMKSPDPETQDVSSRNADVASSMSKALRLLPAAGRNDQAHTIAQETEEAREALRSLGYIQ